MPENQPLRLDFWVELDSGFLRKHGYDEGRQALHREIDSLIPAMRRRAEAALHGYFLDEYLRTEPGLKLGD